MTCSWLSSWYCGDGGELAARLGGCASYVNREFCKNTGVFVNSGVMQKLSPVDYAGRIPSIDAGSRNLYYQRIVKLVFKAPHVPAPDWKADVCPTTYAEA
jgi:hypothetical protein